MREEGGGANRGHLSGGTKEGVGVAIGESKVAAVRKIIQNTKSVCVCESPELSRRILADLSRAPESRGAAASDRAS